MSDDPLTIYRRVHAEVQWHLRRIAHIADERPVHGDGDELVNANAPGLLAYVARQEAARGNAVEAVRLAIEAMEPGSDAARRSRAIAESRLLAAASAEDRIDDDN